jgi:hypothetical protein
MSQQGREIHFLGDVQEGAGARRASHWKVTPVGSHGQAAMTEIKSEWSYTSTPCMCLLGMGRTNWSFLDDDWFKAMIFALSNVNNDAAILIVIWRLWFYWKLCGYFRCCFIWKGELMEWGSLWITGEDELATSHYISVCNLKDWRTILVRYTFRKDTSRAQDRGGTVEIICRLTLVRKSIVIWKLSMGFVFVGMLCNNKVWFEDESQRFISRSIPSPFATSAK